MRALIADYVDHKISPRFETMKDRAVAEAAYSTLVKASLVQSLFQVESFAMANEMPFHLTYIDEYLASDLLAPFDQTYMRTAFALGRKAGRNQDWADGVPIGTDFVSAAARQN